MQDRTASFDAANCSGDHPSQDDSRRTPVGFGDGLSPGAAQRAGQIADGVLVMAQRPNVVGVHIAASGTGLTMSVEKCGRQHPMGTLDFSLGRAVALRLALLASLDPWNQDSKQHGIVRVRESRGASDLMVSALFGARETCEISVRRLVTPSDASASSRYRSMVVSSQKLVGSWKLVRVIGRGAMGTVYRAEHVTLGRVAALKLMHEHRPRKSQDTFRFVHEARAASRIEHPSVVTVFDFGATPDERPFLVMELVEAPTLRPLIESGPVEPTRALRIAEQLTAALRVAHENGIVHRDVKPENVFLLGDSQVKLTDFGCAKVLDAPGQTAEHLMVGTPVYMAPEQVLCHAVDGRADLYAVGCVLFELLTGKPPFEAPDTATVLAQHLRAEVPTLPVLALPMPGLQAVLRKALAKDPKDRFGSANEMRAAIRAVLEVTDSDSGRLAC